MNLEFNREDSNLILPSSLQSILFSESSPCCVVCPALTKHGLTLKANDGLVLYHKKKWDKLLEKLDVITDLTFRQRMKFLLWYYSADLVLEKNIVHIPVKLTQLVFSERDKPVKFVVNDKCVTILTRTGE